MPGSKKTVVGEKTKVKKKNHEIHPDVFLIIPQSCEFWTTRVARAEETVVGESIEVVEKWRPLAI